MADIVITALNAKFIHASLGARYLLANLGDLRAQACLVEMDINQRPLEIVEAILVHEPKIVGLGIFIWNVTLATEVVALLKNLRPDLVVVLGGPEVSFELEHQPIVDLADHVLTGEADLIFREFCQQILRGLPPIIKVLPAALPQLSRISLPYDLYSDADLAHRLIYVETSRGCPFRCEFCLSSLDDTVRKFTWTDLAPAFQRLLDRGGRKFKFVDRTFNLNPRTCLVVLDFFLERYRPGLFLHFEMIPDHLPRSLRQKISAFPPGSLQFEIGIQTFNPEVAGRIERHQDYARLADNLRFLREQTGVLVHADLLAGLPGEDWDSLAAGFDRLVALRPQEIQLGILKRLRGAPIQRHDEAWKMVYNPHPPYEILQNKCIDFQSMQRLKRFAKTWEMVVNGGQFVESAPWLWRKSGSPFRGFMQWTDWLHQQIGRAHSIALVRLTEFLFNFLTQEAGFPPADLAPMLRRDYQRSGRSDTPVFLRPFLPDAP
jgi:radical SAM superfamily enzyme YgiQ (UPF0313 family)